MNDLPLDQLPKGETAWFVHERFGLFLHWGLYTLPSRHEWIKRREQHSNESYQVYFDHFNPDLFDPRAWARAARKAGMRYVIHTAKHHEGFCLWDSAHTEYKVTNTPFGRDILREFVDAFRAEGLHIGFYYSLLDWHHPHYPIDTMHPHYDHPDAPEWNKSRDVRIYAEYMRQQVRELLTDFGKIEILWFDFSFPGNNHRGMPGKGREDWESESLLRLIRELQPGIILNNRLDLPDDQSDVFTPEQYVPREGVTKNGKPVIWETCQTYTRESWGYMRDDDILRDAGELITTLVDSVSKGGNLLMNIGPTGRGLFPANAERMLDIYGRWMAVNERAIRGCGSSQYQPPPDCRYTQNGDRLYIHLLNWPYRNLHLPGLAGRVRYAQFLHDASEIRVKKQTYSEHNNLTEQVEDSICTLELPLQKPDVVVPVIEVFLKP